MRHDYGWQNGVKPAVQGPQFSFYIIIASIIVNVFLLNKIMSKANKSAI